MTKEQARLLVYAQVASDAGKGISKLGHTLKDQKAFDKLWDAGYNAKDKNILALLQNIGRYHPADLHFFVTKDEERRAKYLVYFDFYIEEARYQVSFHCFVNLAKYVRSSRHSKGHWDNGSSRESAYWLGRSFDLCEEIEDILELH